MNDVINSSFPAQIRYRIEQVKGTSGNANGLTEYVGFASPDAKLNEAKWLIKKNIYDSSGFTCKRRGNL